MKSRQQKLTALALLRDTTNDIVLKKQLNGNELNMRINYLIHLKIILRAGMYIL